MAKRKRVDTAPVADSLASVTERWPGREDEVARLFRLLRDEELAPGSLFVHGPSGGGKSGIVKDVLAALAVPHAVVDCVGCSTPRALYESALNQLHGHRLSASNGYANWATCEREAAFAAALRDVLAARGRVCLVLENAEQLAEREQLRSTLLALPNLCRDHRAVPLFVAEALWHDFHLSSGFANVVPVSFAGYSKPQLVAILCRDAPAALAALGGGNHGGGRRGSSSGGSSGGGAAAVDEAAFRAFAGHVVEYFADLCRDVQELRYQCRELFPTFVEPIVKGRVAAGDVSRLMARAKPFLLAQLPKVYAHDGTLSSTNTDDSEPIQHATLGLPTCAKFLVVAAFLASRFPPRVDSAFFCTARAKAGGRRTKRPAPADEPHAFTLERLLAIYRAMQPEARGPPKAEAYVQLRALQSSGWLQRAAAEEHLDGARFRCDAALADVADVAAEISFELSVYLK